MASNSSKSVAQVPEIRLSSTKPPDKTKDTAKIVEQDDHRKTSNQFGNLLPHSGSDHWDEELIPEWLCCKVHDEMISPESSSEESYDSIDTDGNIVKKRRKKTRPDATGEFEMEEEEEEEDEEEEEGRHRTPSLPDVTLDGWLSKHKLRNLTLQQLEADIIKIHEEIDLIQVENLIFDRTVRKMEKREIEIEAALPPFTYKFPWEIEGAIKGIEIKTMMPDAVCGELSDDEPDPPDGIYRAYIPAEDLEIDREAIGVMLTAGDDTAEGGKSTSVTQFLKSFGEIPPGNFDVIKHKYGDLVRFATYETEEGKPPNQDPLQVLLEWEETVQPRTSSSTGASPPMPLLLEAGIEDEDEDEDEAEEVRLKANSLFLSELELQIAMGDFEEDPEFPGFNPHDAKRLPIIEKIKYAQIEEESIREEFMTTETEGIQEENSIQVYVDTYTDSYDLSIKMMDAFKAVVADGKHHLTGKMRAENIMRFREKLKKRFLEEEAKVTIRLTENMKTKRRVDKQLKVAQDIGGTIQRIDYENLRVQNFEYQASIEDQQQDLKKLKYITAEWFEKLERNKVRLTKLLGKRTNLENDIGIRGNLKQTLHGAVEKAVTTVETVTNHCSFLKKRLLAFSAPSTLDYINQKSSENRLKDEVDLLKNKVDIMSIHLSKARQSFNRLLAMAPDKSVMRQTAEVWMDEIKREVRSYNEEAPDSGTGLYRPDSFITFLGQVPGRDFEDEGDRTSEQLYVGTTQSDLYLGGMTQSVMELYKVGKEKKRISTLKNHGNHGPVEKREIK